ncbi:hypothetical protein BJY52DRAFT_1266708 [Lactarius psammicola]|nr:hypothetical protein BJY52DRAFT_1266708 [Lactarius psammicola]
MHVTPFGCLVFWHRRVVLLVVLFSHFLSRGIANPSLIHDPCSLVPETVLIVDILELRGLTCFKVVYSNSIV